MNAKISRMFVLFILLAASGIVSAQGGRKFAHVNSQELLSMMPEYDSAQAKIEKMRADYEEQIEEMQVELNKKYENYLQNRDKYADLIRQTKETEINEMQQRVQQFEGIAGQELQRQRSELLRPVIDKANKTIRAVAEENGYIYVFDIGMGNPIYYSDESVDISPLVKERLGIQ